jgi:hypothetical protein
MGLDPVTMLAAAVVGNTVASAVGGARSARQQKRAATQAAQQAEQAQRQSERDFNRLNQKTPNVAAMMQRNRASAGGGVGGTFLTGQGGAPVASGLIGRSTLLGS